MSRSSNGMGFGRHLSDEGSYMDKLAHQQPNHSALPRDITIILDESGSIQS